MTNTRNLKPKIPGEPLAAKAMPPQEPDHEDVAESEQDVSITEVSSDAPSMSDGDEDRAGSEAAIEAEVLKRLRALNGIRTPKKPMTQAVELPHADEIDATKLKRAVMSKQGWVVPTPPKESEKNAQTMALAMQAAMAFKAVV